MYALFSNFSLRWMMAISAIMSVVAVVSVMFCDSPETVGVFMLLAQIVNLLCALTLLTYASYDRKSFGYGACALFLSIGYVILMYNVFANMIFDGSFYSFSEKMKTLTIIGNCLFLLGYLCNTVNLKNRFEFTWIFLIGSTLMSVFLTSSETKQAIDVFSILGAIFGLILLINVMVVGDRKRFLEDLEQRDENLYEGVTSVVDVPVSKSLPVFDEKPTETVLEKTKSAFELRTATEATTITPLTFEQKKEQLIKLKELLDADILTQEEFDAEKKKILER